MDQRITIPPIHREAAAVAVASEKLRRATRALEAREYADRCAETQFHIARLHRARKEGVR